LHTLTSSRTISHYLLVFFLVPKERERGRKERENDRKTRDRISLTALYFMRWGKL
jgi:hypothetical protein